MDRRAFIGSLSGGLLTAPLVAQAQQGAKLPRVGYLSPGTGGQSSYAVRYRREPFRRGLRELGYNRAAHRERIDGPGPSA